MADHCHGNGPDHCCYIEGEVCPFLEEGTVPGRRWACGLLRELGSWNAVNADPRYLSEVKPTWERVGISSCATTPSVDVRQCCFAEGSD